MEQPGIERQSMEVDIACVGFGPAMGGFLTTLSRHLTDENGQPLLESKAMPGMPLQVLCYERADDIAFGVSGVVTRARGIRASFPDLKPEEIPMACEVRSEKTVYLLDPIGASRRATALRALDALVRPLAGRRMAIELPYTPPFLRKHGGLILSIGQFNQWVGNRLMATGAVQIWPGTPVERALIEDHRVVGVRLTDQGVERDGSPAQAFLPGMDVRASLTVVGDGPVGPVGRQLDEAFGMPDDHRREHWAVGMKMVVELPEACDLPEGTVVHTFGFPEPEIFGFLYVMPGRLASLGVFVPSFLDSPVRTTYRYLQHWMRHPYLWRWLEGGTMRSWGAKTLAESGKQGEPFLVGDGYARIGEGSGSTNVLTGSGVDEAWTTGVQLAEGVVELLRKGQPFTRENLAAEYERRRRESWIEAEARVAEHARDGFTRGFLAGLIGMGLTGLTGGRWHPKAVRKPMPTLEEYCKGRLGADEIARLRREAAEKRVPLHDLVLDALGWPKIEYDGKLLVSHQDALLLGGKVQAPAGFADHVVFLYPNLCEECSPQLCVEICSGQAITPNPEGGRPLFDREKCVHCGACLWNCPTPTPEGASNVSFRAGAGGLHSAEN